MNMKNRNVTYSTVGDYQLPNLTLNQPQKPLGRYGRMRRIYLMEHRPVLYNSMLLTGKLHPHLLEVEQAAENQKQQMMTELLKQKQYAPMSVAQQSLVLFAAERGYLADVELSKIGSFEAALLAYVDRDHAPLMQEINQTGGYNDEIEGKLKGILDSFKATQSW